MRYCVIMCGGVGSRFWPFSRDSRPKQFLDFFGTGRTLIQMTVDRVRGIIEPENILLVTNAAYVGLLREQLPDIPAENILAEPARRNTAPCILWAARHIASRDPEGSMVVLPSDHLILREEEFRAALREGFSFVEQTGSLLTLGITPTGPNTGYGYIQLGEPAENWRGIRKVRLFTEKPDLEMAREFVESGEFVWNAGIFLWSARSIMEAFRLHADDLWSLFESRAADFGTSLESEAIAEIFPEARSISIDYAVMEKADNVFVKEVEIGWSDLGTWNSLYDNSSRDSSGNAMQTERVIAEDCSGTLFASGDGRLIVACGLKDYIVADNGNALLICPREREQEIRRVVDDIRERFGAEFL